MNTSPLLQTERLRLRPFAMNDTKDVQCLAGDKEVARTTLRIPHPYEDGAAEEWIRSHPEKWLLGEEAIFAVVQKETDALIGSMGLVRSKSNAHTAELGYFIGRPYWNQGYCTEAARAVLKFAFESFHVRRVVAHHFADNPASGLVLTKLGMQQEGLLPAHVLKWGESKDLVMYGILKDEFMQLQQL